MTMRATLFAVVSSVALLAAGAAAAQTPAQPDPKTANAAADAQKPADLPVRQLQLSEQLAKYGRETKDPLSLIVAAQIRKQVGAKVQERKPDNADASAIAKDEGDGVAALLKEAKDLSKNDKTIVALADDVTASASKGKVGGGIISNGQITGKTTHNLTMNFYGGKFAEVGLVGKDSSLFVLEVRDQNGNLICRDTDPAYCSFNPIWTGPFVVKVHNVGSGLAHYRLETN
jgi:hypothetical protein